jgi:hypothetical protein
MLHRERMRSEVDAARGFRVLIFDNVFMLKLRIVMLKCNFGIAIHSAISSRATDEKYR